MPIRQPITATPIHALGFPPGTTLKTAGQVLRRMNYLLTNVGRDLVAVRLH